MKRVLITGMQHDYNGVEAFIMSVYRNIDRSKFQFDFLTGHNSVIACEDEIKRLGGNIYKIEYSKKENIFKHYSELKKFFKKHKDEYVAIHMNSCFPNYSLPLKYAKKYGIKVRIFHSHNSDDMYISKVKFVQMLKKIKYSIERIMIKKRANHLFACSKEAGEYMFKSKDYKIINNGIDIEKFKYFSDSRILIRNELGLKDNEKIIGFVGRLQYQKNPMFLLKVFNAINKISRNYKLLIIGVGDKENEMKKFVIDNKIEDKVIFLGRRNDVNLLYSAMDVLCLPSMFEGFPVVLVEAQVSGLKCLISSNVSSQSNITNKVEFLDIGDIEVWKNKIFEKDFFDYEREKDWEKIVKKGFDINTTTKQLENIYLGVNE